MSRGFRDKQIGWEQKDRELSKAKLSVSEARCPLQGLELGACRALKCENTPELVVITKQTYRFMYRHLLHMWLMMSFYMTVHAVLTANCLFTMWAYAAVSQMNTSYMTT